MDDQVLAHRSQILVCDGHVVLRSKHTFSDLSGLLVLDKRVFEVTLPRIHCAYVVK